MPSHPLDNFEVQKYYQNQPTFNGVYSGNNLPNIKDGTYVINFDKYESLGAHWIPFDLYEDNATYFDSFGVEYILKEI